jgi:hypothetical protein
VKKIVIAVAISLSLPVVKLHATPQDEQFQKIASDYIEPIPSKPPNWATIASTAS